MKSVMKKKRQEMDITQDELSLFTGVSKGFISQIETGKFHCPMWLTVEIARILRCDSDTLFRPVTERKTKYYARKR